MKPTPGNIYRNINRNIGVGKFTKDTIVNQYVPEPVVEPIIEEPIQEIKPEENELRHTQVEQETLPSRSGSSRKHS